jgi:phospholipid/cholesterol/gamma-HCH transport system substrate-binding protein
MRDRTLVRKLGPLGLGVVAVAASSCGISLQQLPKIGGISGPTYPLTATFANVVNLPDDAQVRVGGFTVGFVSKIAESNYQAVITMRVKKEVQLPVGSTAEIAFDTPLGEDYVQLQPATGAAARGPMLASGAHIPETHTLTAPSVEDTFGALGALLNGGGIDQLPTIIHETNLALNGNEQNVKNLLNYLNSTVTSFARNEPSIDTTLQAIASLSSTLNQSSKTISGGIGALGPAVQVLASENGDFTSLLNQLDRLSSAANLIISKSAAGTVTTVKALLPLLNQLAGVQQQLGPALSALDAAEAATPHTTPGDYVQLAITANALVPPVPSDAGVLHKVTVDPPDATGNFDDSGILVLLEGGLP